MSEDKNNKDEKQFSFIQEQITSKKKSKLRRMLFSVLWTIALGCIFGLIGAIVFCLSEPTISRLLGKQQARKTVEFDVDTSKNEDGNKPVSPSPVPTVTNTPQNSNTEGASAGNPKPTGGANQLKPASVYIEDKFADYLEIYDKLKGITKDMNDSLATVTCISRGVDLFDNEYETANTTSGLVLANNGADLLLLVSYDRVEDVNEIKVSFQNNEQIDADLQTYDDDLNLAVISISLNDIPEEVLDRTVAATLGDSFSLEAGTPILALGSPNGYVGSMEMGIITSTGPYCYVTDDRVDLFNTDIAYNENGDGVIVNMKGEVIGIITNKLKDDLNQRISTVIGISRVKMTIQSMVNNTDRIYFGIKAEDMTDAVLGEAGIANGICITEVEGSSPALKAGLQSGDVITAMNDTPVMSVSSFHSLISLYKPKSPINVTVRRNVKDEYEEKTFTVILAKKKS